MYSSPAGARPRDVVLLSVPTTRAACQPHALLLGHCRLLGREPRDAPIRPSCSTTRSCCWFRWEVDPSSISRSINSSPNYKLDNNHVSSVGSLLQQTCCCSPLAAWRCEKEDRPHPHELRSASCSSCCVFQAHVTCSRYSSTLVHCVCTTQYSLHSC
jgi:hypothetical protein